MASSARAFVDNWLRENLAAVGAEPKGNVLNAEELASACKVAAEAKGIDPIQIDKEVQDLVSYITEALGKRGSD